LRLVDVYDGDFVSAMNATTFGEREILGVTCDSRSVRPGYLFAAIPGFQTDGRAFIPDALDRGAVAILAPPDTALDPGIQDIPLIVDENPRRQYALMAARFFVDQPKTIACVTGTNGKTSVATFLRQLWAGMELPCASAGTLGVELGGFSAENTPQLRHKINLTTPDPADLHACLSELAGHGVDHFAMEASSHGLSQFRLDGVHVAAAAFTNLTRDHLDYHGGMDGYLSAKQRLFTDIVVDGGTAVINADAAYAEAFQSVAQARGLRVLSFGSGGVDLGLRGLTPDGMGQILDLEVLGKPCQVRLPLPGAFQASNALAAAGLALALEADPEIIIAGLERLNGAPGRVQFVGSHASGAAIYVDYAHTPDALGSVLRTIRPHTAGRLHVVFGCGGDRDSGKRPEMGAAAAATADVVVVTDDNPRTEDPGDIRAQTMAGCPDAMEIADRGAAIATAMSELNAGDILVIAGKGHETGQIVGDETLPFNDAEVVRAELGEAPQ